MSTVCRPATPVPLRALAFEFFLFQAVTGLLSVMQAPGWLRGVGGTINEPISEYDTAAAPVGMGEIGKPPVHSRSVLRRFLCTKRRDCMDTLFVGRTADCASHHSGFGVWGPQKPLVVWGSTISTNHPLL